MKMNSSLTPSQKALVRRYLIWAYKSTRESFERIERKTTQLLVDRYILGKISTKKPRLSPSSASIYAKSLEDFVGYIAAKEQDEIKQKYTDASKTALAPQYLYLQNRLEAIEEAIVYFLGSKALKEIDALFEAEFTRRILESKDH